ncbi:MAG: N-acetyltransferase family protein [Patescibacteria group bacterium]
MRAAIREVTAAGLPALLPLWREGMAHHAALIPFFHPAAGGEKAWLQRATASLLSGEGAVFAAYADGRPAGFIFGLVQQLTPVLEPGRLGYIVDLFVDPARRRHGLGRLLFFAMRDWFACRGINALDIHVYLANPEATAFWRSVGFTAYAQKMRLEIGRG